ncbi:MAG: hypothetical protein JWQ12_2008 [Glaciihabitans sp.]|nr:hypothetical protein [Glaciihabitans sp.]
MNPKDMADDTPTSQEAPEGTPGAGYPDGNDRDIVRKQSENVSNSAAFNDDEIDETSVKVLPGTGGPDDTGDTEVEPGDYNRTGH